MPIKEFECRACSHRFEVLLMLDEKNPDKCPKCGAGDLKRLLSTFRIAGAHSKSARKEDEFGPEADAGMEGLPGMGGMDGGDMGDLGGGDGMDMGGMGGEPGEMPDEPPTPESTDEEAE
jgi:putative FmdB family regulatory protein